MKVVIAGATGFLGRTIARRLVERGDDVVALVRGTPDATVVGRAVRWDGETVDDWANELDGADAIVNLTGKSIGTRPTDRNIEQLITSRVRPIEALAAAVAQAKRPPAVWVQAAAVGIFGDAGDEVLTEESAPSGLGPPELVRTCLAWEQAFAQATEGGTVERAVLLRLGVVIGGGDKTTDVLARLVRLRLGGKAGSGKQWVSWVGIADVVAVIERALDEPSMSGTYHVTSPNPVTNAEMMAALRAALDVGFGLPAPTPAVVIGAWIQGAAPSLVLASQRVLPRRLLDAGFEFAEADFAAAARAAVAH